MSDGRPSLPDHLLFLSFITGGPHKNLREGAFPKSVSSSGLPSKKYIGIHINRYTYTDIHIPKYIHI